MHRFVGLEEELPGRSGGAQGCGGWGCGEREDVYKGVGQDPEQGVCGRKAGVRRAVGYRSTGCRGEAGYVRGA